jgi:peroxiredoxin
LAGFGRERAALEPLGARIVAASVDPLDKAKEVANEIGFPLGYGVTREQAEAIGAWWDERRNFVQPSEFILGRDGKVMASSYSSGPLGRIEAPDVIKLINYYEAQAKK